MEKEGKGSSLPAFLSTHPTSESRIADLRAALPQVLPLSLAARQREP